MAHPHGGAHCVSLRPSPLLGATPAAQRSRFCGVSERDTHAGDVLIGVGVYCGACPPATSQPLAPALDLVMFQTSRKGLGPAEASSRIMPENSTLAMYSSGNSSMPSRRASIITTSVMLGPLPVWVSRSASWAWISLSMLSVIMARRAGMSERSQAACRVTKLVLAALRNPSLSKPAGMPHVCEPISAEPIMEPPWGC